MLRIYVTMCMGMLCMTANAQRRDSVMATGGLTGDTLYVITENRPQLRFFGNLWYTSVEYNWSRSNEFKLSIGRGYGRSFCGGGGCYFSLRTWGAGYSIFYRNKTQYQTTSAFFEFATFPLPPACWRAEYIYDITHKAHYLRPAFGIGFGILDIQYHYSFLLKGEENQFKHGVNFRLKYTFPIKNGRRVIPIIADQIICSNFS